MHLDLGANVLQVVEEVDNQEVGSLKSMQPLEGSLVKDQRPNLEAAAQFLAHVSCKLLFSFRASVKTLREYDKPYMLAHQTSVSP